MMGQNNNDNNSNNNTSCAYSGMDTPLLYEWGRKACQAEQQDSNEQIREQMWVMSPLLPLWEGSAAETPPILQRAVLLQSGCLGR